MGILREGWKRHPFSNPGGLEKDKADSPASLQERLPMYVYNFRNEGTPKIAAVINKSWQYSGFADNHYLLPES
ncbi:hypothetical protein HYN49_12665 [Flavobacterium pallidum]|uniref:Uncharacterized protein n=1 Tax=Flavobacterium pallidum TaxID=2172098 RepID=A0A2S1SJZ3_9FLAO|nr:hypothetical protein HYN49_12665 [Flavobacterium pallidum]